MYLVQPLPPTCSVPMDSHRSIAEWDSFFAPMTFMSPSKQGGSKVQLCSCSGNTHPPTCHTGAILCSSCPRCGVPGRSHHRTSPLTSGPPSTWSGRRGARPFTRSFPAGDALTTSCPQGLSTRRERVDASRLVVPPVLSVPAAPVPARRHLAGPAHHPPPGGSKHFPSAPVSDIMTLVVAPRALPPTWTRPACTTAF